MRTLFILLFIAISAAYGQQTLTSVAVLPSDASDSTVLNNDELETLTDKMSLGSVTAVPAMSDSQAQATKPKPSYTMSALALDVAGVVLVSAGVVANTKMQRSLDKYGKRGQPQAHYNEAWADVKSNRSARNVRYVVGSLFLVSGIGVHIWF